MEEPISFNSFILLGVQVMVKETFIMLFLFFSCLS